MDSLLLLLGQAETPASLIDRFFFALEPIRAQLVSTLVLIIALWLIRKVAFARLAAIEMTVEQRRRLLVWMRNATLVLGAAGLFMIWASELRTLAISLFAVVAAVVLATKELILCLTGGFYRSVIKGCGLGDRIEVNGMRGEVVDTTLFTTTLLEIGPQQLTHQFTGRTIVIPNAIFLNQPVYNENYLGDFVSHVFQVPLKVDEDWKRAETLLVQIAQEETAGFIEDARRHMATLQEKHGLDAPSVEPRVNVKVPDQGKLVLVVRVPCPARRKGRLEQAIMRRFLESYYQKK